MFFQRKLVGSLRAQSLIARYRQEVQKDAQNRSRHFFWLFSALTEHPSPQQIRYIGDEAAGLIRNIILFSVLVYELVGPLLTKMSLEKAGEIAKPGTDAEHRARFEKKGTVSK